mmetsp:Transcript_75854/g.180190  ORF Transcript_75854/g.180190 Transcript_75854/m.180190 type:complete len:486 (+) Transcript_75854:47-1504(+)
MGTSEFEPPSGVPNVEPVQNPSQFVADGAVSPSELERIHRRIVEQAALRYQVEQELKEAEENEARKRIIALQDSSDSNRPKRCLGWMFRCFGRCGHTRSPQEDGGGYHSRHQPARPVWDTGGGSLVVLASHSKTLPHGKAVCNEGSDAFAMMPWYGNCHHHPGGSMPSAPTAAQFGQTFDSQARLLEELQAKVHRLESLQKQQELEWRADLAQRMDRIERQLATLCCAAHHGSYPASMHLPAASQGQASCSAPSTGNSPDHDHLATCVGLRSEPLPSMATRAEGGPMPPQDSTCPSAATPPSRRLRPQTAARQRPGKGDSTCQAVEQQRDVSGSWSMEASVQEAVEALGSCESTDEPIGLATCQEKHTSRSASTSLPGSLGEQTSLPNTMLGAEEPSDVSGPLSSGRPSMLAEDPVSPRSAVPSLPLIGPCASQLPPPSSHFPSSTAKLTGSVSIAVPAAEIQREWRNNDIGISGAGRLSHMDLD